MGQDLAKGRLMDVGSVGKALGPLAPWVEVLWCEASERSGPHTPCAGYRVEGREMHPLDILNAAVEATSPFFTPPA